MDFKNKASGTGQDGDATPTVSIEIIFRECLEDYDSNNNTNKKYLDRIISKCYFLPITIKYNAFFKTNC